MSDRGGMAASSLAVTERKPQRTGGYTGIFFQLFDWNRRFAKKKLFSKKLLSPVRSKQGSKKFGEDKKQAKHRLIADENSGGFPNVKNNMVCEKKPDTRSPGLVARLMGLESMPVLPRDRPKKVSLDGTGCGKGEKPGNDTDKSGGEERKFGKIGAKQEFRPRKFDNMGPSERQQVARFGTEVLQIKSMLSQPRKNQAKLASPVVIPRNVSARNASWLAGAAARILEPGLQRSRTKTALAYTNTLHRPKQELVSEEATDLAPDVSDCSMHSMGYSNTVKHSCKNCGNSLDVIDYRADLEEEPSTIHSPVSNCTERHQVSKRSMPRGHIFSTQEQNGRQRPVFSAAVVMDVSYSTEPEFKKKPTNRGIIPGHLTSQGRKLPNNGSSLGLMHNTQKQNQLLPGRDIVPPRLQSRSLQSKRVPSTAKAINETTNFVAMNKSLSGQIRTIVPTRADIYNFETERRFHNRSDSLSTVQKRRLMNTREDGRFSLLKESSGGSNSMRQKEIVHPTRPINRSCIESKLVHPQEPSEICSRHKGSDNKSPVKQKTRMHAEAIGRMTRNNSCSDSTPGKLIVKESNGSKCSRKPFALRGDRLGEILEQKLKELTCHEDEFAAGVTTPRKTTATILQELISALTEETQIHCDDFSDKPNRKSGLSHPTNMSHENASRKVQAKEKSATDSRDIDHFSPGTVLEDPFSSNESCFSSSLDECSRDKSIVESVDFYYDESRSSDPKANHLVSAAHSTTGNSCEVLVADLVNNIPEVLQKINLAHGHLKGSKLSHAKEVLLNAELMLGNAAWSNPAIDKGFSVTRFLIYELETLENAICMSFNAFLGFEDAKQEDRLRVFMFDYVLEYLDSKFSRYSESGFRAWTNLLPCLNTEMLVSEILKELKMWMALAGLIPDELIEWEMSHSLGKWTDFEIELYENGVEIDRDILHSLVDEVVLDLCLAL
nr:Futsch light chain LC(F) like [Ipomoea batatas]